MPNYPMIDADGHVIEHTMQIIEHMQPPYNDPHPYRTQAGGLFPSLDGWPRVGGFATPGRRVVPDVHGWTEFLDQTHLAHAVLFPTAGLGYGLIQNKEYAVVLANGYNTWLAERYTKVEKRLKGMALIPVQDPHEAAKELRRAVTELGFVGAVLPAANMLHKAFSHPDFDPLLAEAERLGVPLALHGAPSRGLGFDYADMFIKVHTLAHPISQLIAITNTIFDGTFDRFPRLKMIFLEAGCGWVPFMVDRLQEEMERRGSRWCPTLKKEPIDYIRGENFYVTCEVEETTIPFVAEMIGEDHLLFASDFPHERNKDEYFGDLPHLLGRTDLTESLKRKILFENPSRVYNLAPEGQQVPQLAGATA